MKRVVGLLGIVLIVLNSLGYYALMSVCQQQMNAKELQKFEAGSSELGGDLVLAIPIEVPYLNQSEEYTEIDGEFIHEGQVYQMVKQKFWGDKLYVVCAKLENFKIHDALADYSKLFSDQEAGRAESSIKIINSISKDYFSKLQIIRPWSDGWAQVLSHPQYANSYFSSLNFSIFHPPRFIS